MQLVAWTVNHGGNDLTDHYTIHETADDATLHFYQVMALDNCHCATIGDITNATEPQWLEPVTRKLFSLVTDTDAGTEVQLFTTEAAREDRCRAIVKDWWGNHPDPIPDDWQEALADLAERLCEFWIITDEHEIAL